MRYLHRTHRISIAVLNEIVTGKVDVCNKIDVGYTSSNSMAADIFTKGFSDKNKWSVALKAINILDRTAMHGQ